jgi:serine/threonine protein kinase
VLGEPPPQVGRFVIRARLGAGAFATVYRAYDPQLDRDVALKVPYPGTLDSLRRIERFLGEARAAARLRHPHIVPVYDAGCDGPWHYIASAFIEGKTLAGLIDEGPIHFHRGAEIVRQLAEALAYAHKLGIVHRDVKPANILIDEQGQPCLTDFGLAFHRDAGGQMTPTGTILGTPSYMAPEQAGGKLGDPLPASDQYSLGAILYELLCGVPPFAGPPPIVIYNAVYQEPVPPRQRNPQAPVELERICLTALAKRPEDRYASCKALADALQQWREGLAVEVLPHAIPVQAAEASSPRPAFPDWLGGLVDELPPAETRPALPGVPVPSPSLPQWLGELEPEAADEKTAAPVKPKGGRNPEQTAPGKRRKKARTSEKRRQAYLWAAVACGSLAVVLAIVVVILNFRRAHRTDTGTQTPATIVTTSSSPKP